MQGEIVPEHVLTHLNQEQTLKRIIETSYDVLLGQVGKGRIVIENEASFQLHFAYILKTIGELMQFSPEDTFAIKLETPYVSAGTLNKSGSKKAKIDIVLEMKNLSTTTRCAVELKFFQKVNMREPNNRYDVYRDLQNLEDYVYSKQYNFGLLFIATDHIHYVSKEQYSMDTADFDFRHGAMYKTGRLLEYRTTKPYGDPITLLNEYKFTWENAGRVYFLKHLVELNDRPT